MDEAVVTEGEPLPMWTLRHVRLPLDEAVEFSAQIVRLAEEFIALPRGGDTVYALLAGVYPTTQPALSGEDGET